MNIDLIVKKINDNVMKKHGYMVDAKKYNYNSIDIIGHSEEFFYRIVYSSQSDCWWVEQVSINALSLSILGQIYNEIIW